MTTSLFHCDFCVGQAGLFVWVCIYLVVIELGFSIDGIGVVEILFHLAAANFRRARQVYHFDSFVFEEVKFAFPVVADHECIYVILVHVGFLLFPAFFRNYEVYVSYRLDEGLTLLVCEVAFLLLGIPVEFIGGYRDDQVISKGFGSSQEIDVSVVEQIVCAVCDDSFH